MTDDEFIFLSYPQERLIWDGLFRRARLAEYDPKRFRKLFGHEYTPDQMLTERKRWTLNLEPSTLYEIETIPGFRFTSGSPPLSVTTTQPPQVVSKFPSAL